FDCKGTEVQVSTDGSHPTLRSMAHSGSHQNAGGHAAVAFTVRGEGFDASEDGTERQNLVPVAGTICRDSFAGGAGGRPEGAAAGHFIPVAFDMRGRDGGAMPEGPHDTANLRAASGGSSRSYIAQPWAVRRLTPRECERLMGFPDDFTAIPWRGK